MKRVKFYFHSGFVGASRSEIMEFEDDVTDSEIEEAYMDWLHGVVDMNWWVLDEDDDSEDD